jgi:hypothetical protein
VLFSLPVLLLPLEVFNFDTVAGFEAARTAAAVETLSGSSKMAKPSYSPYV